MDLQARDYKTEITNVINMLRSVKENLKMMMRETEDVKKKTTELLAMKNIIYKMKILSWIGLTAYELLQKFRELEHIATEAIQNKVQREIHWKE